MEIGNPPTIHIVNFPRLDDARVGQQYQFFGALWLVREVFQQRLNQEKVFSQVCVLEFVAPHNKVINFPLVEALPCG